MGNHFVSRAAGRPLCQSRETEFLFSAMELETAVRLKLNLVRMASTDETYDMVSSGTRKVQAKLGGGFRSCRRGQVR